MVLRTAGLIQVSLLFGHRVRTRVQPLLSQVHTRVQPLLGAVHTRAASALSSARPGFEGWGQLGI
eukprot:530529-Rhodomonas_salina.1